MKRSGALVVQSMILLVTVFFGLSAARLQADAASPFSSGTKTDSLTGNGRQPSDPENSVLERIGSWPFGPTQAVKVDLNRSLAFVGSGGAVLVLDITEPQFPSLVSNSLHTDGQVMNLAYDPATQRLFIAAGEGGLEIWDVQDAADPQRLAATEIYYVGVETPVNDVSLSGNYAILDTSWGYVHSVDISDPTNPVDVSFNGQGGNPTIDVYTDDSNHAYACGPKFQRFIVEPNGALNGAGSFNFTSLCGSVFVENDTNAYVGYGSNLYILDLLAPGYLPWSITMVGGVGETVVRNNYAYIINRNYGLAVYDVSNVQSPSFVSSLDTPGFRPYDLEIAGDFAFVADGRYGLQIINIAHPQSPTLVGSYETFYGTYDAFIGDSYAYSPYGDDGVLVMALSDPANPILVGQYDTPGDSYDVWVDGDRAYVADTTGGLRIADVTTPTQPVELGFVDTIDAWRVTAAGDYAYVIEAIANEPYWLHVVDVSDPANPIINGSVEMSGILWEVAVSGNYVYLAAADAGLRVIDVSDPTVPVEVSYYPAPDVFDVQIRGTYAYLAAPDFNGGFLILDISDPTDPTLVVRYNPGGQYSFFHVAVSGNFAYLGDPIGAANVTVLDIADPANPIHLDEVVVPGDMFRLLADGKYLYVADGDAGLGVYRNSMISDYQATLGPNSVLQASPGTTVTHTFTLENLGLTDTYTLTVSGPTWQTSLLTPSPVTVLAGEAITIEVSVEVPADPGAPSDSFILSGASLNDPNLMLTATGTTMVLLPPEPTFEIYLPIILAP